jgi:hypothetical protein
MIFFWPQEQIPVYYLKVNHESLVIYPFQLVTSNHGTFQAESLTTLLIK